MEKDGDGSYLYRWDVREETREMGDDMAPVISYSYNEVRVWPTLTANKILEACINALWDKDVEQKKLNDYNAASWAYWTCHTWSLIRRSLTKGRR